MKESKWILLAEDNAPLAELTTLALGADELACDVVVAQDGAEALDCLHRRGDFESRAGGHPVFVLLDLKMPKVDGLEVLRQVKSDARFKNIPVIVFSSSRDPAEVSRCYQLGANAYVVKSADFKEFSATVKSTAVFWATTNELPLETETAIVTETREAAAVIMAA